MKRLKKEKAITLVSLVITIVILLILAGISISTLTNTGIFEKAKEAKKASENAEKEQNKLLEQYREQLNKYMPEELTDDKINKVLSQTENTFLKDTNGNSFTLPAGFKVVVNDNTNNAKTVDKGIVIEDATVNENGQPTLTNGSQFVWVPVGTIYTNTEHSEENARKIVLGRYNFDISTGKELEYEGDCIEEDINDNSNLKNYGNIIAKNIAKFKSSVKENGGYYIGRYEARTNKIRTDKNNELTQITEKGTEQIYNYVTQPQAAKLSQDMYKSINFTSDLANSYAWDTATIYIQECAQKNYSIQNSLNKGTIAQTGTNMQNIKDVQCNIFDMASNVWEWTTETCYRLGYHGVGQGGSYDIPDRKMSFRGSDTIEDSNCDLGFRTIIYINM